MTAPSNIVDEPCGVISKEQFSRQIQEGIPPRPMQRSCCCGRTWDVLDTGMCCLNICPMGGVAFAFLSGHPYFAAIFGASALGNTIAHGLVRKYGSLSSVVEKLTKDEGVLTRIFDQFQSVVSGLEKEKKDLSLVVGEIQDAVKDVDKEEVALSEKVKSMLEQLNIEKQYVEDLKCQNEQLKSQIDHLKDLTSQIKVKILEYQEQNTLLSSSLKTAAEQVANVEHIDQNFKEHIAGLDMTFDEDLADFAKTVLSAQQRTQQISEQFFVQNKSLTEEIEKLQSCALALQATTGSLPCVENDPILGELEHMKTSFAALEKEAEVMRQNLREKQDMLIQQGSLLETLQRQLVASHAIEEHIAGNIAPLLGALSALREKSSSDQERISSDNALLSEQLRLLQHKKPKQSVEIE